MSEPLISLRGVSFRYPERAVLRAVDLDLYPGERLALVGGNGAGKTTLLHLIVGLKRPSAGDVRAFGHSRRVEADFREVRARAGLLFQDSDDQLFCPTVLEDVAFGPLNLGRSVDQARADAESALSLLGLDGFSPRVTHRLSAGEKRLVALATVLAMDPDVLLLDEPTNGLDAPAQARLTDHLAQSRRAMLICSHDQPFLIGLATRAVVLRDGGLCDAVLHAHPHTHRHSHLHLHAPAAATHPGAVGDAPPHPDHQHAGIGDADGSIGRGGHPRAQRAGDAGTQV